MSSLYIDRKGTEIKLSGEALMCYENGERIGLSSFQAEKIRRLFFWLNLITMHFDDSVNMSSPKMNHFV